MNDSQNTHINAIDTLTIEAEARQMRAQFIANGIAAVSRKIASLFTNPAVRAQN